MGITKQIAPATAVENILVKTFDHGMSNHDTFMAACEEFDLYLTEHDIKRPVVLLSDGHSSQFDFDILRYLLSKQVWLFISPPDTTGLTQLLEKINKNLHHKYRKSKNSMFNVMQSPNKEAFMVILAEI